MAAYRRCPTGSTYRMSSSLSISNVTTTTNARRNIDETKRDYDCDSNSDAESEYDNEEEIDIGPTLCHNRMFARSDDGDSGTATCNHHSLIRRQTVPQMFEDDRSSRSSQSSRQGRKKLVPPGAYAVRGRAFGETPVWASTILHCVGGDANDEHDSQQFSLCGSLPEAMPDIDVHLPLGISQHEDEGTLKCVCDEIIINREEGKFSRRRFWKRLLFCRWGKDHGAKHHLDYAKCLQCAAIIDIPVAVAVSEEEDIYRQSTVHVEENVINVVVVSDE